MAQMSIVTVAAVLSVLTTMSQAFVFEVNVNRITPGKTQNVQLACKVDQMSMAKLKSLYRIQIIKPDLFGSEQTFADLRVSTNTTFQKNSDVIVTSNLNENETFFLMVTWPIATEDTLGSYSCRVDGYDKGFVSVNLKPIRIKERILTEDDVDQRIQSVISGYEKKQQLLELEMSNMKKFYKNELTTIKQQCQDENAKVKTEMSNLKQEVESSSATKDELAFQISRLTNFTMDEISSISLKNGKIHDNVYSLIGDSKRHLERNISRVKSEGEEDYRQLASKVDQLETKENQSSRHCKGRLVELKELIKFVDHKFENTTNELRHDIVKMCTKDIEKRTSTMRLSTKLSTNKPTSTSTTTSTPPPPTTTTQIPCNKLEWPQSTYALVKPTSGCPASTATTDNKNEIFDTFFHSSSRSDFNITSFLEMKVRSGTTQTALKFCSKPKSTTTTTIDTPAAVMWPKGSYCILQQGVCPKEFGHGQMNFFVSKDGKDVGFLLFRFCCRNDGDVKSAVRLPCGEPFYLYRHKGTCQRVAGMGVGQDYVTAQTSKDVKISVYKSGLSPDIEVEESNSVSNTDTAVICHYQN